MTYSIKWDEEIIKSDSFMQTALITFEATDTRPILFEGIFIETDIAGSWSLKFTHDDKLIDEDYSDTGFLAIKGAREAVEKHVNGVILNRAIEERAIEDKKKQDIEDERIRNDTKIYSKYTDDEFTIEFAVDKKDKEIIVTGAVEYEE
ncbi:MAG: hypothetical protein HAW67_07155, partial [Endozoicomonadaceae bacterium]|nr:hypothetical protein [Endozoicomonadaceae bacterium]